MGAGMAGKNRGLQCREGRYYARIIVPEALRAVIGKTELRTPLGADRRDAIRKLPIALADFGEQIERARCIAGGGKPVPAPLSNVEIAKLVYNEELAIDELERDLIIPEFERSEFKALFEPARKKALRRVASGDAKNDEAAALVGYLIDALNVRGAAQVRPDTPEWRSMARMLAGVMLDAMDRQKERDHGDYTGNPSLPILNKVANDDEPASVSLSELLENHVAELALSGCGKEASRRWRPCFASLVEFIGHDDAKRLTRQDIVRWKKALLEVIAPKTIRDCHIAGLKAVLKRAVEDGALNENVADSVKMRVPKAIRNRDRGYSDAEALAIIKAARAYVPAMSANPQTRERATLTAAKRWVPVLQAFSGARVAEICQLRGKDFDFGGEIPAMTITPEAGSVKTGEPRSIPLHKQLLELGLQEFVKLNGDRPLFFDGSTPRKLNAKHPARTVAGRVSGWMRDLKIIPDEIQPTHGWRHRLKTVGRDVGADSRVMDAIQGHAPRTAGDGYGTVSLVAMKRAMDLIPAFNL